MASQNDLKVTIDAGKCLVSSICTSIAPTAFQIGSAGRVELLDTGSVDRDTLIDAVEACPTKALILDEADGTRIWPKR